MLDDVPVATVTFLVGVVLILIGYALDDISIDAAFEYLVMVGGTSFGIGYVRNQAGRGLKK